MKRILIMGLVSANIVVLAIFLWLGMRPNQTSTALRVSTEKGPEAATITPIVSETLPSAKPHSVTYTSFKNDYAVTIISPSELEYREGPTILLGKYSKEGDRLRVVVTAGGATQVIYFQVTPDGLETHDGKKLLSAAGRSAIARSQINLLTLAIDSFEVDTGSYPYSLDGIVSRPAEAANWKGPYLKKGVPIDPWGHNFVYRFPGTRNPRSYDLLCVEPDGRESGNDDITNFDEKR